MMQKIETASYKPQINAKVASPRRMFHKSPRVKKGAVR